MDLNELWGFGLPAWITIVTVLTMFSILLFTKLRADMVFMGAVGLLLVTGVLDAKEAMSGFSSTSVVVIGVLFVVVAGLTYTGVLQWIVKNLLGQPKGYARTVVRLMLPVAALSSFLSNTTVVALFVGIVKIWSKKLNISPSKLLIPLSYASGMGGVCTLIGTPPNLIISGLYADKTNHAMNVLATALPGIFCLAVGVLSVIALRRLLPDRQSPESHDDATTDYTVELIVPSDNRFIGETIGYAELVDVEGGRLLKWRHFDNVKVPINKNEFLMGGDRLTYAGDVDKIQQLAQTHGLTIGDEVVNVGLGTLISSVIMIAMVVLSATGVMSLLQCAFLAAAAMLLCRCCTPDQAMKSINWDILLVFAGSVVLGLAIQKTGIAERLATGILDVCGTNPIVVMTVICLVGTFITEFISNTAAGAMFFPIMYEAAEKMGYDPYPFLIALMISVSSSFATPIGSPTHMLVYGPGGYRFSDFMRIGLLMNLIILAANIFIVNIIYPLTPLQ
ncbi:Di-and tricarboxylate transporter [Prevotella communis]|jgi:di/tricarboxylate transporter|uniref:Di-and tricarboxylate transporter n=1 Tax=Prevotella communis TaxID=2913614 RepID=A0A1H0DWD8_9BACT|nr:SLC13 family permease [Prevotella communis]SDG53037.1 Di-and tricarboxylate transporter [Prevotella communis]SDN74472.1 Di-and tricarboxylate transporter [Prevotella communis]